MFAPILNSLRTKGGKWRVACAYRLGRLAWPEWHDFDVALALRPFFLVGGTVLVSWEWIDVKVALVEFADLEWS